MPNQFKRYVVRHRDVSPDKSVAQFFERFVVAHARRYVRRDNQIKRLDVHQLNQFLKVAEIISVAIEKVCELVPKENYRFEFVRVNDFGYPMF